MITRRNWLLRCSILINIAVLLYICSHAVNFDNNLQISPAAFLVQQQSGGVAQQLRQDEVAVAAAATPSDKKKELGISSNNKFFSNNADDQLAQNPNNLMGMIPKMEQHLQQQQQQEQQQMEDQQLKELMDNNADDSRFEVPTELIKSNNALSAAKLAGAEILYSDIINLTSTNLTNFGEGFITDRNIEARLKSLIKCFDKNYSPKTLQRGDFWVLKNYIRAEHGELRCFDSITYTTHADYTFLDNLIPLLERWMAPISIALHAPGTDYTPTVNCIKYLRDCAPEAHLVRQFVTFHIYFSSKHIPRNVLKEDKVLETQYNCSMGSPFTNATTYQQLYKTQKKLLYPVNVGRNVARDAAMTYFILASDIELYPNPGLVRKFLEMIARNEGPLQRTKPRVFPLSIFEVDGSVAVPKDKTELQDLFTKGKAIQFHKKLCPSCHGVPKSKEWMLANETDELGVFHVGKRVGYHLHWEPIYIGTHYDPHYDERLSWEGKSDKMTQGYALCALDYEFHILDNAFLVHKPGIKVLKKDPKRAMLAAKTNQLIKKIIYPELQVMYGVRKGCAI